MVAHARRGKGEGVRSGQVEAMLSAMPQFLSVKVASPCVPRSVPSPAGSGSWWRTTLITAIKTKQKCNGVSGCLFVNESFCVV